MNINLTSGKRVNARHQGFVMAQSNQVTARKPWKSFAAVAFGLLLSVPGLAQTKYNFTTIDVPDMPGENVTATTANGNSTSEIVGQFFFKNGPPHGFVLNNGVFTTMDAPGGLNGTGINGVNASGQLAGTYLDGGQPNVFHAFFENNGYFTTIDPPKSIQTASGFLNTQGQVVGTYRTINAQKTVTRHGFIWLNGIFTTFNVSGDDPGYGTRAFGINDLGEVVGDYLAKKDGLRYGYLRSSNGAFTTLKVPNAVSTTAEGINNDGTIVGFYTLNDFTHGFVFTNGVFTTVDVPDPQNGKAQHTEVESINANGEIVGFYSDPRDVALQHTHGFVGVPVP